MCACVLSRGETPFLFLFLDGRCGKGDEDEEEVTGGGGGRATRASVAAQSGKKGRSQANTKLSFPAPSYRRTLLQLGTN